MEIRATVNGSEMASYRIGQPDMQVLRVPADASVTLTGKRYLHTLASVALNDFRSVIQVSFKVEPEREPMPVRRNRFTRRD